MPSFFRINTNYLLVFFFLLIVEICIAIPVTFWFSGFLNSPVPAELVFYPKTQTVLETFEIQETRKPLSFGFKFTSFGFIRGFLGDILAVILMYSFLRSFLSCDYRIIVIGCLLFACSLEIMQFFRLADHFKLSGISRIVLGSTYDPLDILAYLIGFSLCMGLGYWRKA